MSDNISPKGEYQIGPYKYVWNEELKLMKQMAASSIPPANPHLNFPSLEDITNQMQDPKEY